jgi:hypothetical protein
MGRDGNVYQHKDEIINVLHPYSMHLAHPMPNLGEKVLKPFSPNGLKHSVFFSKITMAKMT